jgi:hypothetical protein
MLDDLGHPRVRVLDGGIGGWIAAGGALTADIPSHAPGVLHLREHWTRTIDMAGLVARLGDVSLLDARATERYRGDIEPVDAVPGHIPTARSLPTGGSLGPDGRLRRALRARFAPVAATGVDVVTSCGSVTACHTARDADRGPPIPLLPGSYSDSQRAARHDGDHQRVLTDLRAERCGWPGRGPSGLACRRVFPDAGLRDGDGRGREPIARSPTSATEPERQPGPTARPSRCPITQNARNAATIGSTYTAGDLGPPTRVAMRAASQPRSTEDSANSVTRA